MQDPDQKFRKIKSGYADTKAVAIENREDGAPVVTAKGRGLTAERILDIAFAEGVKVRQDSGLVDLLDAFDVESPIPVEALHAVNLILERVYQEDQRLRPGHQDPPDLVSPQPRGESND